MSGFQFSAGQSFETLNQQPQKAAIPLQVASNLVFPVGNLTGISGAFQGFPGLQGPGAAPATVITESVTEPSFTKADDRFGELRQVDQIRDTFLNARRSIDDLRASALESTRQDKALLFRVLEYLRKGDATAAGFNEARDECKRRMNALGVTLKSRAATIR